MGLSLTSTSDFARLFDYCTNCPAFSACGGAKTAPCECAWKPSSGFRKKCSECSLICTERKEPGPNGQEYRYEDYLAEGRFFEQLAVIQERQKQFPLYVPLFTEFNKNYTTLPLRWAAANIATLLASRKKFGASLRKHFDSPTAGRKYLSVNSQCNLWAIFNGKDSNLESLWGMGPIKRFETFTYLKDIGFSLATSTTFSVSELTHRKTPMPQAHNVVMQTRNNQVTYELQEAGLNSVPNVYWRDGDQNDIQQWVKWLIENPHVSSISRDFTSTRRLPTALEKMNELLQILKLVKRSFHIIIVGTGVISAPKLLQILLREGHTATIVTSSPIFDAGKSAVRYVLNSSGVSIVKIKDGDTPRAELILNNLKIFEQMLSNIVIQETGESEFLRNIEF